MKVLGVVAAALIVDHAGAVGVGVSTGPMHHVVADHLVELWLFDPVGDLGRDQGVEVGRGGGLVRGLEDDEDVGVWQASFLQREGGVREDESRVEICISPGIR